MLKKFWKSSKEIFNNSKKSIINLRVTCHKTSVNILECFVLNDKEKFMKKLCKLNRIEESIIIQTCNRVEIYVITSERDLDKISKKIESFWIENCNFKEENFNQDIEWSFNKDAILHLFRLTAGLDSIILGEDQVLGQIKKTFKNAKKIGTTGTLLDTIFTYSIKTGKKVRNLTKINEGSLSIGNIVVDLLHNTLGTLKNKEVIIIGAGQVGSLIGKILASLNHAVVFITNRTYERALRLANELGGRAVRFDDINEQLINVDVVIVATSAPHYILRKKTIQKILENREDKSLYLIDLAQPRNIEETVSELKNVKLYNIEEVNSMVKLNLDKRSNEIKQSEIIINKDLKHLCYLLKNSHVESIISNLYCNIEEIRNREVKKALKKLGALDKEQLEIIKKLSQVLMKRVLHKPIINIRKAFSNDDETTINFYQKLFELDII